MTEARKAADCFRRAAALNRESRLLQGSLLHFPDYGQLVMTGDLHAHNVNFEKIKKFCALASTPVRHVILHELIHGDLQTLADRDMSHQLLLRAAEYKCEFPEQVHFLQSNHELAQLTGQEISKGGRCVTREFEDGVRYQYGGAESDLVLEAIREFIASYPLAGRTANGIFLSHSLPSERAIRNFDLTIFDRVPAPGDLRDSGSGYALVWGRYHEADLLEYLAGALDVNVFIVGHQPQEFGYDVQHDRLIILASDHNHGVFLPFDLKKTYTANDLVSLIRKCVSVP